MALLLGPERRPRGARRARRRDRPRQRRGRDGRTDRRIHDPATGTRELRRVVSAGADPCHLVAGQPRVGHRRARADLAVGPDGPRDGGEGPPPAGVKRAVVRLHEHVALVALAAIAVHGLALLGDQLAQAGLARDHGAVRAELPPGVHRPRDHRRLPRRCCSGPSFYLRRRIGARRWRKLHRATVLVWVLSAVHTLGAGSDGVAAVAALIVLAPVAPIVYLLALRFLGPLRETATKHPRAGGIGRSPLGRAAIGCRGAGQVEAFARRADAEQLDELGRRDRAEAAA